MQHASVVTYSPGARPVYKSSDNDTASEVSVSLASVPSSPAA